MAIQKRTMRRSSLVSTWGVGSIVPFPHDESLMIAGLDAWEYGNPADFQIDDERLKKRLGVRELRWPPDYRVGGTEKVNLRLRIPAVRFPTWHYCPFCGSMKRARFYDEQPKCDQYPWQRGRVCKGKHRKLMIPERFIVACENGHIDDFPVAEWLHSDGVHRYDPENCHIRRSTGGSSASLSGVTYECTCGAKKTMGSAMRPGALERIGFHCRSCKPWLGIESDSSDPCNCEKLGDEKHKGGLKVLLRGATNVWFSIVRSSIWIPAETGYDDDRINTIVQNKMDKLPNTDPQLLKPIIDFIALNEHVDADILFNAFINAKKAQEKEPEVTEDMPEDEYRKGEYKVLLKTTGGDSADFRSINNPISMYNPIIAKYFNSISLIPRLRETRAFAGFTRLSSKNVKLSESKKQLRLTDNEDWLPAIRVFGEGIFFEFNESTVKEWVKRTDVVKRIGQLNASYQKSFMGDKTTGDLNPEFIMIHTFAHLLINQLSFDCGYGSSSLRERIYCERTGDNHTMHGVLIYTSSGDSEGSLGGLVRQGKPGFIEETIINAVKNAGWCSSDPVCIQSAGQGPDSLNLAACHNCALLPETCCETGNRLLDRGVIVGTLDNHGLGFFSDLND